jgi:NitT/TauT family transport system ATP-binding protein
VGGSHQATILAAVAQIVINAVTKFYGSSLALREVSLTVEQGSFTVLVGPSGCGKSTLLSLTAGLDFPSSGSITIGGGRVKGIREDVALIFQHNNLFPWATACDNVAFGLEMRGLRRRDARSQARQLLQEIGLGSCLEKVPEEMSGGMKQRVALARAIALQTKVILMDEPFGSLDYQTRKLMQLYLLDAWERAGSTVLLVTHDLSEAITLADRLVVLSGAPGMIQDIIDIEAQRPRDTSQPKLAHLQSEIETQLERAAAEAELTHEEQQRMAVRHNYG